MGGTDTILPTQNANSNESSKGWTRLPTWMRSLWESPRTEPSFLVTTAGGKQISLDWKPQWTVGELKSCLSEKLGVATQQQKLVLTASGDARTAELTPDTRTLSACGVAPGSTVTLHVQKAPEQQAADAAANAADARTPEQRAARYTQLHKLGEGGYGKVMLAKDTETGEHVAVKLLDLRRLKLASVEREVQFMRAVAHPNVLKLHDAYALGQQYQIVLELCPGGELFDLVTAPPGQMEERRAARFFGQLISATHACHRAGVAHRDIKLENILLDADGNLKLIDFGLAAWMRTPHARHHEACGSKSYAAPEVLARDNPAGYAGPPADAWSCGICLFAMLSGFFPLDEATARDWRFRQLEAHQFAGRSSVDTIYGFYRMQCGWSKQAKAMVDSLLAINPHQRASLAQLARSEWMVKHHDGKVLPWAASASSTAPGAPDNAAAASGDLRSMLGPADGAVSTAGAGAALMYGEEEDETTFRAVDLSAAPSTGMVHVTVDDDYDMPVYRSAGGSGDVVSAPPVEENLPEVVGPPLTLMRQKAMSRMLVE